MGMQKEMQYFRNFLHVSKLSCATYLQRCHFTDMCLKFFTRNSFWGQEYTFSKPWWTKPHSPSLLSRSTSWIHCALAWRISLQLFTNFFRGGPPWVIGDPQLRFILVLVLSINITTANHHWWHIWTPKHLPPAEFISKSLKNRSATFLHRRRKMHENCFTKNCEKTFLLKYLCSSIHRTVTFLCLRSDTSRRVLWKQQKRGKWKRKISEYWKRFQTNIWTVKESFLLLSFVFSGKYFTGCSSY